MSSAKPPASNWAAVTSWLLLYGLLAAGLLTAKVRILAVLLPDLPLLHFLEALRPQAAVVAVWLAIGWVGLVLSPRWLVLRGVVHAVVIFTVGLLTAPLVYGLETSGSSVRWILAAWWLEFDGVAEDGAAYLRVRVLFLAAMVALVVAVGLAGPRRREVVRTLALALAFFGVSQVPPLVRGLPVYLVQDPLVYLVSSARGVDARWDAVGARPVPTGVRPLAPPARRLNLVFVYLESVGGNATSLAPPRHPTTPFLEELSGRSLWSSEAYVVVPSTYKAHVASLCGVEPYFTGDRELTEDAFDFGCLPAFLRDQGYRTVYFTSSSRRALGWDHLTHHLGFEELLGFEDMDRRGYAWSNGWAYEDDMMLAPSEAWLRKVEGPFVAAYMVCAPHFEYLPVTRHGWGEYSADPLQNNYLNAVNATDAFLRQLYDQYARLGLLRDTVFVVMGDHGESFGEHLPLQHNASPYEEVLKVPLLFHQVGQHPMGEAVTGLRSQLDVAPTLMDWLGIPFDREASPGRSWLAPGGQGEVYTSCLYTHTCAALVEDRFKLVHHFGEMRDELFDRRADPWERRDVAAEQPERVEEMRDRLRRWYFHGPRQGHGGPGGQSPDPAAGEEGR